MNTVLTTTPGRLDNPPSPKNAPPPAATPAPPSAVRTRVRLRVLDRLALHLGLALITWSRRSRALESRERRATRAEQQFAIVARERAAERMLRLGVPPR